MALKNVLIAIVCTTSLAWSGQTVADQYRADEFLGLDLSRAVLSPKPLGPASQFAPGPLDLRVDRGRAGAQASTEPKAEPNIVIHKTRLAHMRADVRPGAARTRLARRQRNPLDAQAFDTRVQVWPCKSGGICNWKRSGN